jgi:predicted DsbA family dithiol-disulfide isomerase
VHERTRAAVEAAGLEYGPPDRIPRSRKALALAELARDRGRHRELHERLMRAYWSEGRDIGAEDVLVELALETGLDEKEARAALTDEGYRDRVAASTRAAQAHGVNAVPAFVLGDRLLVLGAQPHEVFEGAIARLDRKVA